MSGEVLYERYKDALKRGHVASLRGQLDVALAAYAEAAEIAPDRATPHTSAGTALLRGKRPEQALHHYAAALRLVSQDEGALQGRAQALADLGRRAEAADAFDTLADVRAEAGRLSDAVDAARRGLELAEGRQRRRGLERLIARLRASEPDAPGRQALEQALKVLEGSAMVHGAPLPGERAGGTPVPEDVSAEVAILTADADAAIDRGEPGVAVERLLRAAAAYRRGGQLDAAIEACFRALDVAPEDLSAHFTLVRFYRELGWSRLMDDKLAQLGQIIDLDGEVDLTTAVPVAVEWTLAVAASRRQAGNVDAAIDACYEALSVAPDDVDLHLALVDLYAERGWATLATEKLDLLARLATLDEDDSVAERVRDAREAHALPSSG